MRHLQLFFNIFFVYLLHKSASSRPLYIGVCFVLLQKQYPNRPIVEFEIAAQEQMKITELRLAKLFTVKGKSPPVGREYFVTQMTKADEDRVNIIGAHLTAASGAPAVKASQSPVRTRPPISTHVLDVSRGSPGMGIEVWLEMWKGTQPLPLSGEPDSGGRIFQGSSITDNDGRSGHLRSIVDNVEPGIYRISFNTGKYCPNGFFPYVSIIFEIKESQRSEHFHKQYPNRPIVEFEIAAQEQMKITELRLAKLFTVKGKSPPVGREYFVTQMTKAEEDRVNIIGAHLTAASGAPAVKASQSPVRTRPPISTHVLDVSRGSPGMGIEVWLEMWKGTQPLPLFGEPDSGGRIFQGSSITDNDGRSGHLMSIVDNVEPGINKFQHWEVLS
ncbi:hypothetical protein NE237_029642 [Protea cynaroides]|uniref:Transthyretin/hydroxyisourate hydrolase domain-containing protein n=1 Tax=Protea cynaroides TaxID=273540 RepID=A0A9Q0GUN0_9MAGN|nr:hypothetical protein NE237_029642 [Protea cynaroides]